METRRSQEHREVGRAMGKGTTSTSVIHTSGGVVTVTADYSMKTYDFTVKVSGASVATAILLPPVSEARGKIYTIWCIDSTNDPTLDDNGDEALFGGGSPLTFTDANDYAILFSNGERWFILASYLNSTER